MDANGGLPSREEIEGVRNKLHQLAHKQTAGFQRTLMAIGYITTLYKQAGIRPIVVGGHAVELYTVGHYTTVDVDLVLSGRELAGQILEAVGFEAKRSGMRHWYHPDLALPIEIPDNTLAGSLDKVLEVDVGDDAMVFVIGIEDLVIDRLESAVHHKSLSDMEWAEFLLQARWEDIDWDYIEARASQPQVDVMKALKELKAKGPRRHD